MDSTEVTESPPKRRWGVGLGVLFAVAAVIGVVVYVRDPPGDGVNRAEQTVANWCDDHHVPDSANCVQAYIRSNRVEITGWCVDVLGVDAADSRASTAQRCVDEYFASML
jgi:hypothetical protein